MRAITGQKYTLEEYFELERNSAEKWEFWDGHVWCMSGANEPHESIVSNVILHLRNKLGRGCRVYGSNLKVAVPNFPPYRYPDLSVVCNEKEIIKMGGLDVLANPQMVIEVLSKSTEAFDRGDKFTYYKSIASLTDYMLVSTKRPFVTHFCKGNEGEWRYRDSEGFGGILSLPTFGIEVQLAEIYLDVDLPNENVLDPESERPQMR